MPVSYISPRITADDDYGRPIVGGQLYTYVNRTTIPKPTYQDAAGTAANTNPVILDANGSAVLYLIGNEMYTFVLRDKDGALLWTQDDILGQLDLDDLDKKVAEAAAETARARNAADAATLAAGVYPSTAVMITGDANFPPVQNWHYASVPSQYGGGFLDLYQRADDTVQYVGTYPNRDAVVAVLDLIGPNGTESGLFELLSDDHFILGRIYSDGLDLPGFGALTVDESGAALSDSEGFGMWAVRQEESYFGPLYLRTNTDTPELLVVSEDNFILNDLTVPSGGTGPIPEPDLPITIPYISPLLCGAQGTLTTLYVRNMLTARSDINRTIATLSSAAGVADTSTDQLRLKVEDLGASASLVLRPELGTASTRNELALTVASAPVPAIGSPAMNILMLGDSITNRQGAQFLNERLTGWGYAPTFFGTIPGSASPTDENNTGGPMGEGREAWAASDVTYVVTTRGFPINPGDEAAYLAMDKDDKLRRNPFIRVATGSDDPADVRNGYILDFAFYQSRFSLPTPDVVAIGLNTNDITRLDSSQIYDTVYANDRLIAKRMRAAWPNVRIVRWMPGTPRYPSRDEIWSTKYIPAIRAMLQAAKDMADADYFIAPTWAMVTQETGYRSTVTSTDAATGATTTIIADAIHPVGVARRQLFDALAPYAACAGINII